MTPPDATTDFSAIFEQDDPWGFASLWYEARKRDLLMATLPEPRYARALEAGCATGLLTERLAARCDALLAIDMMPRAIERTRVRVAGLPQVETRVASLPDAWPGGCFDLIVLSELGYYFDREPWLRTVADAAGALTPAGTIVACHWLHPFSELGQSTRHVHAAIARRPGLHRHVRHVEPDFLLEVWSRNPEPLRSREPMR